MANRKHTKEIIIHCSATSASQDIGKAEIDRWHRSRGWLGIGYHFVIRRDGTIEVGRPVEAIGAHCKGHNTHSIGICLVGGVCEANRLRPEDNFTPMQRTELVDLLHELNIKYPYATAIGHNEVSSKDCPSFDVQAWLPTVGLVSMAKSAVRNTCETCGQPLP